MPELIDELNALKKQVVSLDSKILDLHAKLDEGGKGTTAVAARIEALEKQRDTLIKELNDLKAAATARPPAPADPENKPKPKTKEDDDGDEAGFW